MASEVGTAYVTLLPTAKGFKAAVEKVVGGKFQDPLRREGEQGGKTFAEGLKSAGGSMTSAGQYLTTRLTAPIIATGGIFVKMGGDFEASMNGVRAVTGATGKDFDALREKAKLLGSTTAFSASEAANAMEFLGMAGWTTEQIMVGLDDVLNLAAASNMDLASAADIASNVMSGFGIEASQSARVADVLAATAASANTDVFQLGEALKYTAPLASAAGWSLEETAAAIGFLGNAGIQGSMAGTGLNSILATLADTSSTGGKKLAEFGVAAQDANGQVRPLTDVLKDLSAEGADVADVISIFGLEAGPKLQALIGQGSEGIEELIANLENAEGTAANMADIRMEGFAGGWKTLQSAFEGFAIAVADSGLLQWATDFVNWLAAMLQQASQTNPQLLKIGTIVAGVAAAIGPLLTVGGLLLTNLGKLLGSAGGLTGMMGKLGGAVRFIGGPWGILIGLLVTAFATSEEFREAVMGLIGTLFEVAMVLFEALMPAINSIMDAVVPLITTLATALAPILTLVGEIIGWIARTILPPFVKVIGVYLSTQIKITAAVITWLIDKVLKPLFTWLGQKLGPIIKWVGDQAKKHFAAMQVAAKLLWDKVRPHIDSIRQRLSWVIDRAKEMYSGAKTQFDKLVNFVKGIPGKVKTGLADLKDRFMAPFKAAFNAVARLWNSTVGNWSISIPNWVPEIGGKGFSMPKIPTAASGGSFEPKRGGVLAVLAEAGVREHAMPEPMLEGLLQRAVQAGSATPAATGVTIDGRGLDRHLLAWLRSAVRLTGGGNTQRALGRSLAARA